MTATTANKSQRARNYAPSARVAHTNKKGKTMDWNQRRLVRETRNGLYRVVSLSRSAYSDLETAGYDASRWDAGAWLVISTHGTESEAIKAVERHASTTQQRKAER